MYTIWQRDLLKSANRGMYFCFWRGVEMNLLLLCVI
jgi:hypothetical protein